MSTIFVTPLTQNGPELPLLLDEIENAGYSVIGHIGDGKLCLVRVWASDEIIQALTEDRRYVVLEHNAERKLPVKGKADLIQLLRDAGIPPGQIIREQAKGRKALMRAIVGVTDSEYRAAGGRLEEE